MNTCSACKTWDGCCGFEHYSWGDFRFCRNQVYWFLIWREVFEAGKWPPKPTDSGYVDQPAGGKHLKAEATFAKPAGVYGDIMGRLERTGKDGRWLLTLVDAGYLVRDLPQECRDALNYASGWKMKTTSYNQWLAVRKSREVPR